MFENKNMAERFCLSWLLCSALFCFFLLWKMTCGSKMKTERIALFPWQQWLHHRFTMLRHTYIACLFLRFPPYSCCFFIVTLFFFSFSTPPPPFLPSLRKEFKISLQNELQFINIICGVDWRKNGINVRTCTNQHFGTHSCRFSCFWYLLMESGKCRSSVRAV